MPRTHKGFVITNRSKTQFVGCTAGYYYASDFMRHALILSTLEEAIAITRRPITVEYWDSKKLRRLMRIAVIKPATLTIED